MLLVISHCIVYSIVVILHYIILSDPGRGGGRAAARHEGSPGAPGEAREGLREIRAATEVIPLLRSWMRRENMTPNPEPIIDNVGHDCFDADSCDTSCSKLSCSGEEPTLLPAVLLCGAYLRRNTVENSHKH